MWDHFFADKDNVLPHAGVFPVVISSPFALALTIYIVATHLLLYYVRTPPVIISLLLDTATAAETGFPRTM